jgi:diguanylate cyclase (GGDEF)-like protein
VETYLRLVINIFTLLVAVILFLGSRSRSDRSSRDHILFTRMIVVASFVIVLDAVLWCVDGRPDGFSRFVNITCNGLYYAATITVPMMYALYVLAQIDGRTRRPALRTAIVAVPAALCVGLSLLSIVTGSLYFIDAGNVYQRGPLFPLYVIVMFSYFAFTVACVIVRHASIDRRSFISFILVPFLPACSGVIQLLVYGLNVIWPSIVVSLLLIYVNVQQRKLSIDYLSGVNNRRRLDEYLEERIEEAREKKIKFAAFLADMDDFKRINDDLGHKIGDRAIIETARIMRSGIRARDFLARFAGDEFVAVLSPCGEKELNVIVARVRSRLARDGAWTGSCPPVAVSIGAAIFDPENDKNADAFIRRLDALMYREKTEKKRARRIAGHT